MSCASETSILQQIGPPADIPGLTVYDLQQASRGYWLNKLFVSLRPCEAAKRASFAQNEDDYFNLMQLPHLERELVRKRDYAGMLKHGANVQLMYQAANALGLTALDLAQAGGASLADIQELLRRGGYRAERVDARTPEK